MAICASNGARLCTKKECKENCSADTGCEFDLELIWSSATGSPTTAPSMEPLVRPTSVSSMNPAQAHSIVPTGVHSIYPSQAHSMSPSQAHSSNPSKAHLIIPTEVHSTSPSQAHTTSHSQAGWCEGPRAVPDGQLLVADPPGGITEQVECAHFASCRGHLGRTWLQT